MKVETSNDVPLKWDSLRFILCAELGEESICGLGVFHLLWRSILFSPSHSVQGHSAHHTASALITGPQQPLLHCGFQVDTFNGEPGKK